MATVPQPTGQLKQAPKPIALTRPAEPILRGTKTLLIGAPGSGKTTSLTTFIEAGLELFVLITDPGGEEALLDAMAAKNLPLDKLHWHYVASASPSWDTMIKMTQTIQVLDYKGLTEIKSGIEKKDYQQFMQLIIAMKNFKCDRTGEEFGPIDFFGPDRAFAIDSLSGVNTMAMDMLIGAKPAAHQGEWGVAMNAEEKIIKKCCADLRCFFCLTAHVEKEMDETIGRPMLMVGALGRKLAPKLPKDFSDVVIAYREGVEFFWSTTSANVDLKARTLPLKDKLLPSFGQIVESWKVRKIQTETSIQPSN